MNIITKTKPKVILDLDGVMVDFQAAFAHYVGYATGKPKTALTRPTSWDFWAQWGLQEDEFWKLFEGFELKGGYRGCPAIRGARDGVVQLAASNLPLSIATVRGCQYERAPRSQSEAKIHTLEWLRDNVPVRFEAVHFTPDKSGLPGDILLDDAVHHLEAWRASGRRAICFDQPWNREWDGERVTNWREAVWTILEK